MALTYGFSLRPTDNSTDFANALHSVIGDGVARYGGQFALTVNGFSATIASGYAFAAGRWIENDESLVLPIRPAGNTEDRTDAIVARVDYANRVVALEVLTGVDAAQRNDLEYCIILYLINVRRGVAFITQFDITDVRANKELCGTVLPLSVASSDVLQAYRFLTSGIDEEVNRVIVSSNAALKKADENIAALNEEIRKVDGTPQIGELLLTCITPTPEDEWLLCDGKIVPSEYSVLRKMIGFVLPDIPGDRHRTYIYAGMPGEPDEDADSALAGEAIVGIAIAGKE